MCLLGFYCCDKTPTKSSLGKKGFIWLKYSGFQSLEGSQDRNWRQQPGGRNWSRSHRGTLLTGLLLLACSICFLIPLRTTCPGIDPPTLGWAFPHQQLIKKCPTDLPTSNLMEAFSHFRFLFPDNSNFCQAGNKLARTKDTWIQNEWEQEESWGIGADSWFLMCICIWKFTKVNLFTRLCTQLCVYVHEYLCAHTCISKLQSLIAPGNPNTPANEYTWYPGSSLY